MDNLKIERVEIQRGSVQKKINNSQTQRIVAVLSSVFPESVATALVDMFRFKQTIWIFRMKVEVNVVGLNNPLLWARPLIGGI
jgi:hypothetical protein